MATASVTINDVSISEGNSGTKTITFTVRRSDNAGSFSVNYATANGSAVAGSDYTAKSGKLTFTAGGGLTQTVSVTVRGDTTIEANENFFLKLSGLTSSKGSAAITDGSGTATITNDDSAPTANITINNVTVTEGNSGTQLMTFTVTRSDTSGAFSINYATADGTATAASGDYVAKSGKLSFAAGGPATQTVSVAINGDTLVEGAETLSLNLSGLVVTSGKAAILDGTGTGTIANNDVPPADVTVSDVTVTEGDFGTQIATFTVSRSDSKGYFSVDYATADGTANAGADYVAKSGRLTFTNGGALTQTVSVTINHDIAVEGDETFALKLSNLINTSGGANIVKSSGAGTIANNDNGTITVTTGAELSAAAVSAEGGETILLADGNYGDVTINGAKSASLVTIAEAPGASALFGQLTVKWSDNLSIEGIEVANTSFTDSNEYAVFLWGDTDIELRDLYIHGSLDGDSWNDARGLRILSSSGILIDDAVITDVKNGIMVEESSGLVIANSELSVMREGINLAEVTHALIDRNTITDITPNLVAGDHSDGIQIFTGTTYGPSSDITISNNALMMGGGGYMQGIFIASQTLPARHSNILIENNIYSGISGHGITLGGTVGGIVRGNTVLTAPGAPYDARLQIDWSDSVQVYDNIFSGSLVTNSTNVAMTNNLDTHFGGTIDATSVEANIANAMNPGTTDVADFAVLAGSLAESIGVGADVAQHQVTGDYAFYAAALDTIRGGGVLHHIV